MLKWEYGAIALQSGMDKNMLMLTSMGEQGWELVTISSNVAYFKRPKCDFGLLASDSGQGTGVSTPPLRPTVETQKQGG